MSSDPAPAVPQLSWWSFGLALAVTLGIFFLLHPLWRPLDIAEIDRNILWSYAPIPALVLGLLALERKLRWSSWMLETLRLTLVKFAITFLFANVLWFVAGPPGPAQPPAAGDAASAPTGHLSVAGARSEPQGPPPMPTGPTPIDPARTGRIDGLVVDGRGSPRAGVLVAVTGGLEGFVFAPRLDGVVLRHDGDSLQPAAAIVQVGEPLVLRGGSDRLHTAAAVDDSGREAFNLPLVPGAERRLHFEKSLGPLTLRCTVDGRREHATRLAIVDNPFAAWTGEDGRYRFEGVPAGELIVTAFGPARGRLDVSVRLEPHAAATLDLTLP